MFLSKLEVLRLGYLLALDGPPMTSLESRWNREQRTAEVGELKTSRECRFVGLRRKLRRGSGGGILVANAWLVAAFTEEQGSGTTAIDRVIAAWRDAG